MKMDNETFERVKTAVKYQKMAVNALFPDSVTVHLDVIENEFKKMLKETFMEPESSEESSKKTKKVTID